MSQKIEMQKDNLFVVAKIQEYFSDDFKIRHTIEDSSFVIDEFNIYLINDDYGIDLDVTDLIGRQKQSEILADYREFVAKKLGCDVKQID